jgi:exodeoxyribonuclease VII large subunit
MLEIFSVAQLTGYIKDLIEEDGYLQNVTVKGEISNFIAHRSGHWYFTLKDENSQIKAVMFRGSNMRVNFKPEDGHKVVLQGKVSVYEGRGEYQIYATAMKRDGLGDLYVAFEEMKARLSTEGLFDMRYKKPLPNFPSKIGVITSANGAAVRDIKNIASRRCPSVQLVLYPALVQGAGTEESLIKALDFFENEYKVDTIIIGRGGGSIEDLWGFNGERLARKIFSMQTPVVSAVGHETDFTICDFVADLRAPTPSAAAELTVPDINGLLQDLDRRYDRLTECMQDVIEEEKERLHDYIDSFKKTGLEQLRFKGEQLKGLVGKIETLNPLSVLTRGYSVSSKEGKTVKSVNEVAVGELLEVRFVDGKIKTTILEKEND